MCGFKSDTPFFTLMKSPDLEPVLSRPVRLQGPQTIASLLGCVPVGKLANYYSKHNWSWNFNCVLRRLTQAQKMLKAPREHVIARLRVSAAGIPVTPKLGEQ